MTARELRRQFWQAHPTLSRRRLPDGSYMTDTRCAFVDFVDAMARSGLVSEAVAQRVTLGG